MTKTWTAHEDFTQEELELAFSRVENKDHWKMAINAVVVLLDPREMALIRQAVIHFTGSVPTFSRIGGRTFQVRAAGYYAAVGA